MTRHSFDPVSFVLGLLVVGLGVAFATGARGSAWVLPVVLIGVGTSLTAAAIQRALTSDSKPAEPQS